MKREHTNLVICFKPIFDTVIFYLWSLRKRSIQLVKSSSFSPTSATKSIRTFFKRYLLLFDLTVSIGLSTHETPKKKKIKIMKGKKGKKEQTFFFHYCYFFVVNSECSWISVNRIIFQRFLLVLFSITFPVGG